MSPAGPRTAWVRVRPDRRSGPARCARPPRPGWPTHASSQPTGVGCIRVCQSCVDVVVAVRHRLSHAGDRQLNCSLHLMAITQIAHHTPDVPTTSATHRQQKPPRSTAMPDTTTLRRLVRDAHPDSTTSPGAQGATTATSTAGSTPITGSSDQSLPGPPAATLPTSQDPLGAEKRR